MNWFRNFQDIAWLCREAGSSSINVGGGKHRREAIIKAEDCLIQLLAMARNRAMEGDAGLRIVLESFGFLVEDR